MKNFLKAVAILVVLGGSGYVLFNYWPYIFSRTVTGVITDVQRVSPSTVVVGGGMVGPTARELFSFAVGIRESTGEIVTASSEDRQWAVAQPGQCASAKYYPYPPWDFGKSGTYFGARLLKLHVCESGQLVATPPAGTVPPAAPPAEVAAPPTVEGVPTAPSTPPEALPPTGETAPVAPTPAKPSK